MSDDEGKSGKVDEKFLFSEEEMIKFLSSKYNIVEKVNTPSSTSFHGFGRGIKHSPLSIPPHIPSSSPSTFILSRPPKIPPFSGDEPTPKGEIFYYEWNHEVQCLHKDPSLLDSQVLQSIRSSLRGTARHLVVSLGEFASIDDILHKLSVNYSEPARQGITMKEFFNATQGADESVAAFGCRLEFTLQKAFEGGTVPTSARNEMLCERLWSGLRSDSLRTSSVTSYKIVDINKTYD